MARYDRGDEVCVWEGKKSPLIYGKITNFYDRKEDEMVEAEEPLVFTEDEIGCVLGSSGPDYVEIKTADGRVIQTCSGNIRTPFEVSRILSRGLADKV